MWCSTSVSTYSSMSAAVYISLPVMGTLTIEDGQITVWRDYFDPAVFDSQLAVVKAG